MKGLSALGIASIIIMQPLFAHSLRDPTQPPGTGQKHASAQSTSGTSAIIYGPNRKLAYINGKYYKVGNTVDNATIIRIKRHQVLLETDEKTFSIHVPELTNVKTLHKEKT